jgi:DNA polymerase-3 subunit alpha
LIDTDPDDAHRYVAEARRLGIDVKPPDIEHSQVSIDTTSGDVVFGFSNITHIGVETARYIVKLRDKYDLTSPEKLHDAIEAEWKVWNETPKDERPKKSPRQKFRSNLYEVLYDAGCWDRFEDRPISLTKRQKLEKEYLKVILTDNTSEIFEKNNTKVDDCDEYFETAEDSGVDEVRLPGVVAKVQEHHTRKDNKAMGVVTIEYEGDEIEFVVFPQQWKGSKFLWKERTPGIFDLKRSERNAEDWIFQSGTKLK